MNKRALFICAAASVLVARCSCSSPPPDVPRACDAIANVDPDRIAGLAPDVVWGFADLHAHPAIERAFGTRLIWGDVIDDAPVNASLLPPIDACPVETHDHNATSPIDRAVGSIVFPQLAGFSSFAHAPVGTFGSRTTSAWPNARDLIHQGMNVSSMRRAYEGGLRLMFASTTDDQVVGALLSGPNAIDGFVPDASADYISARAQLDLIETIAANNTTWMTIATTPAEARTIIQSGKLALVLSLEMEGLRQDDVDKLAADYPIAHIVPIHLIDNDIGGTAANGPIFNGASAEVSAIYRRDGASRRSMDIGPTPRYDIPMTWPFQIGTLNPLPVYASIATIPYSEYASSYCYDSVAACSVSAPTRTSYVQFGQENRRGLCSELDDCGLMPRPGAARIEHLMAKSWMIDLSHMGRQSVADTLAIDSHYPFIATHGDIAHLCDGVPFPCVDSTSRAPGSERSLEASAARDVVSRHGVFGFTTGMQNYSVRSVISARGGPVLSVSPSSPTACVAKVDANGSANGCAAALDIVADATPTISRLDVSTDGGISSTNANGNPFVRVEMRAHVTNPKYEQQHRVFIVPMSCSAQGCTASVDLETPDKSADPMMLHTLANTPAGSQPITCGALQCNQVGACDDATSTYTIDDIERVTLQWLFLECDGACNDAWSGGDYRQCQSTWGDQDQSPIWTINGVTLTANGVSTPIAQIGRAATPIATLASSRGAFTIYERTDRPSTEKDVPASGHLLKLTMVTGPSSTLSGASPSSTGTNVCLALRRWDGGVCKSVGSPIAPDAVDCPSDGTWSNLNQRGEWVNNISLYTFARFSGDESSICGLDVAMVDWPAGDPVDIDEIRVEAAEDPLAHWIRRYAEVERFVANGQLGTFALGTDFNGLNGLIDISEFGMPADAENPSACPVTTMAGSPKTLAPMRFRNPDGTGGAPILIEERGIATYGLLADMLATVKRYPDCGQDVYDSVMLSAEATLRAWEWLVDKPTAMDRESKFPMPRASFSCERGVEH